MSKNEALNGPWSAMHLILPEEWKPPDMAAILQGSASIVQVSVKFIFREVEAQGSKVSFHLQKWSPGD